MGCSPWLLLKQRICSFVHLRTTCSSFQHLATNVHISKLSTEFTIALVGGKWFLGWWSVMELNYAWYFLSTHDNFYFMFVFMHIIYVLLVYFIVQMIYYDEDQKGLKRWTGKTRDNSCLLDCCKSKCMFKYIECKGSKIYNGNLVLTNLSLGVLSLFTCSCVFGSNALCCSCHCSHPSLPNMTQLCMMMMV